MGVTGSVTDSTAEAARELVERDRGLHPLSLVLDAAVLSEALGREVAVSRLRYKPGKSLVAALDGPDGPAWVGAYTDPVKTRKAFSTARRAGVSLSTVDGEPQLVVGSHEADRGLARPLARLRTKRPETMTSARLLRHNPGRRMLWTTQVDEARGVLKLASSDRRPIVTLTRALADDGVPVVASESLGVGGRAELSPWWGTGELDDSSSPGAARAAGHALASLHAWTGRELPAIRTESATALVHTHALAVTELLPDLATRLAALVDPLAAQIVHSRQVATGVPVHGDLSADQVLVDGDDARLIDLDRTRWDVPARDLGSLLASAQIDGVVDPAEQMVAAYASRRGHPGDTAVAAWQSLSLLGRAVEPFRRQAPDWAEEVARRVGLAEDVLR